MFWKGLDSLGCQFKDRFGVCVSNCSLGLSGLCKTFYIRSVDLSLKVVSEAMSKKQSEVKASVPEVAVTEVGERVAVRPQITGDITKGRGDQKVKLGKISLWIQEQNSGTSRPILQGNIKIGEDVSYVVAWLHGWKLVKMPVEE